jgi:Mg-chelatase subunit ChlD
MRTEILVITDRSGSMSTIANDVIGGYNKFISDQRKVAGEARVTYTQFDNQYEVVYQDRALADVPLLSHETFKPRGGTALLDAIGRTLNDQGRRISHDAWAELVIVVIITDGEENASREFSRTQIQTMIKHAEDHGWSFVYLGANQDAFSVAQHLGINTSSARNYIETFDANAAGTQAAYASMSINTVSLRSGGNTIGDTKFAPLDPQGNKGTP